MTPPESLRELTFDAIMATLATAEVDRAVGIATKKHDEVDTTEGRMERWAALIPTRGHGQHYVKPHVHEKEDIAARGNEYYLGLRGRGLMHTGLLMLTGKPFWDPAQILTVRGEIVIEPETIHCLENIGDEPFILVFCCPPEHMTTDRKTVDELPPMLTSTGK